MRSWLTGRRVFRLSRHRKQAEHVLELGDGRPAAFLDGQQRQPGFVRRGAEHSPGGACLDNHHADVVRYHVVQVAGYACPFLPDGPAGGLLLLFGEPEQPGL